MSSPVFLLSGIVFLSKGNPAINIICIGSLKD